MEVILEKEIIEVKKPNSHKLGNRMLAIGIIYVVTIELLICDLHGGLVC